ncbi:hypothetical protein EVAR_28504_1 [Eumeta japonica]|uniref:Uncharacterized protein n=1 Tax=Eumeta variegata TaxID=151549 RepID=A0A4C1WRH8_EUMVA|nr:hypothetical protein EVAR_28504_1 [Eumeta japonica]
MVIAAPRRTEKERRHTVCEDYCRLNALTKKNRYPIPRVRNFTYQISGKTIFFTLDLSVYQQVNVREEEVKKTAIITPIGLFEFPRMCPALKKADQTF